MKKELIIHFLFLVAFFLIVSLYRLDFIGVLFGDAILTENYTSALIAFWVGGVIGTLLPDVDHFIYIYFLKPHEVTSQRVTSLMSKSSIRDSLTLMTKTNKERTSLVFHNAIFQSLFVALAYFVVTSSGSYLGMGIVLAFLLHLVVDQAMDLVEKRTLHHWFEDFPIKLDADQQRWYVIAHIVVLFLLGLFL